MCWTQQTPMLSQHPNDFTHTSISPALPRDTSLSKGLGVSVQLAAVLQSRAAAGQASALSPVVLVTAALTACREQQCLQHLGLAGRNGEFTSATRIAHVSGPTVQGRTGTEEPGSQVLLPTSTTPVPLPGAGNAADIFGTAFKAQLNQLQLKTS